jgi:hypothetical protein
MATPTTLPSTFAASSVLTSTQMNDLRGAFRVLQVVSVTKTDTFSATVAVGATQAITGFTATITPSSTSSLVLATYSIQLAHSNGAATLTRLSLGGTAIAGAIGDAAGSRQQISGVGIGSAYANTMTTVTYLDSPASTSALTYGVIVGHSNTNAAGSNIVYLNRSDADTNNTSTYRSASFITLMEISA